MRKRFRRTTDLLLQYATMVAVSGIVVGSLCRDRLPIWQGLLVVLAAYVTEYLIVYAVLWCKDRLDNRPQQPVS